MFTQRKTKARDRGEALWFLLPDSQRTAARVLDELSKEGITVSKASVCRWARSWKGIADKVVDLVELPPEQAPATSAELAEIPPELRDVLPDRLLLVARGEGLDRIEHAICILSDGLAARADEIVGDDKSLLVVAGALSAMAAAMERIVAARATVSMAHRSYCEGDRLLAEADLHRATAKKLAAEFERSVTICDLKRINGLNAVHVDVYPAQDEGPRARTGAVVPPARRGAHSRARARRAVEGGDQRLEGVGLPLGCRLEAGRACGRGPGRVGPRAGACNSRRAG
jgi:hypothetical protein